MNVKVLEHRLHRADGVTEHVLVADDKDFGGGGASRQPRGNVLRSRAVAIKATSHEVVDKAIQRAGFLISRVTVVVVRDDDIAHVPDEVDRLPTLAPVGLVCLDQSTATGQ